MIIIAIVKDFAIQVSPYHTNTFPTALPGCDQLTPQQGGEVQALAPRSTKIFNHVRSLHGYKGLHAAEVDFYHMSRWEELHSFEGGAKCVSVLRRCHYIPSLIMVTPEKGWLVLLLSRQFLIMMITIETRFNMGRAQCIWRFRQNGNHLLGITSFMIMAT